MNHYFDLFCGLYGSSGRSPGRSKTLTAGGLRKIADATRSCTAPGHDPPSHIVLEPGVYEYTCTSCGARQEFVVAGVWT